jgi:anthranilate synthase component 1
MLVDLARHELYKLCETKSVEVTDLYTLEHYPNLYHLVSGVHGILKKDKDAIDALLITLPAGTLSGAPKQEAMKMIEQYEGSKRGFYGGASGMVGFNGGCNTGITIRSTHVRNGKSEIRGGAGIVALSTPEGELNEVKLKISKAMSVLEEKA